MKRLFAVVAMFAALTTSAAQDHVHDETDPEVLAAEVYRRGNLVEDTELTFARPDQWAITQVTQIPADDSHKWFISIITQPKCPPCERLKRDFINSPYLSCWANPTDREASWAHYNVYNGHDATQVSRWKNIRISAYPTIVVQPPRSGQFGPPGTVVFQRTGYDGNPQKLGADIRAALTQYAEKHYQYRDTADEPTQEELAEDAKAHAQAPPFPVPGPVVPTPDPHVQIPPPVQPGPDDRADPTQPGGAPEPMLPWVIAGAALAFALYPAVRAGAKKARSAIVSDLAKELRPAPRRSAKK
jgi:hypothetical protein